MLKITLLDFVEELKEEFDISTIAYKLASMFLHLLMFKGNHR